MTHARPTAVALPALPALPGFVRVAHPVPGLVFCAAGSGLVPAASVSAGAAPRKAWAFELAGEPLEARRYFAILVGELDGVPVYAVRQPPKSYGRVLTEVCDVKDGNGVVLGITDQYTNVTLTGGNAFGEAVCADDDPDCFCLERCLDGPPYGDHCEVIGGPCNDCCSGQDVPFVWHFIPDGFFWAVDPGLGCDRLNGYRFAISMESEGPPLTCNWSGLFNVGILGPNGPGRVFIHLQLPDPFIAPGCSGTALLVIECYDPDSICADFGGARLVYRCPMTEWNCAGENVMTYQESESNPGACTTGAPTLTLIPGP